MAQLVVRNLDDDVKKRLKKRAEKHGRSMEEEVRDILRAAVTKDKSTEEGLGTRFANHFRSVGLREGEEIQELRGFPVRPAEFDK
jgi:antitoxin FitA